MFSYVNIPIVCPMQLDGSVGTDLPVFMYIAVKETH